MEVENNNRFNNIIKDLKSDDKEKIIVAIKQLRSHGQKEAIAEILEVYTQTKDEEIKSQLTNLLFDLKSETAIQPLFKAINEPKYKSIKPFLISIFWQSSLDASEHLNTLVNLAVNGDYTICLEVLTVIENFDTTFDEQDIVDAVYDIDEALDDAEDIKYKLLLSIKEVITNLAVDY
ncbi:MAG: hypothetical protein HYU68_10880 [Bacteroidetes bacterium]|nr:hypothetical protein [Bacteroidota bacterium]